MKGEGSVAGEGSVVGVPKFHSWNKCNMPLTNINSDRMSNAFSGQCINLCYLYGIVLFQGVIILFIYTGPSFCIVRCNIIYVDPLFRILYFASYFASWGVM